VWGLKFIQKNCIAVDGDVFPQFYRVRARIPYVARDLIMIGAF